MQDLFIDALDEDELQLFDVQASAQKRSSKKQNTQLGAQKQNTTSPNNSSLDAFLFDAAAQNTMQLSDDKNDLWHKCLQDLRYEIDPTEFTLWIEPIEIKQKGDVLILIAVNSYFVKRINEQYLPRIKALVKKYGQSIKKVQVLEKLTPPPIIKKTKTTAQQTEFSALNPEYTFDAFARGKSNALAYNACYDMGKKAQNSNYASIFIYGSSGLGKTHLMQSVAHRYKKAGKLFCYFSSDTLMSKIGQAFAKGAVDEFVSKVQQAELLIVDDIHMLKSKQKPKLATVFINLYDAFMQANKRVILASDKPPMEMEGFDTQFLSRFSGGLTVVIDPPEMDTRISIIEKKSTLLQLSLPKECAIFIAQNVAPDVRRLEGAIKQVHAQTLIEGDVDLALVRRALKNQLVARARSISADNIKDMVAEYYGVSIKDLVGKRRVRNIARPRQVAMALMRQFTNESFPDIGQAFGGRDHSTVIHACEKVAELCQTDPVFEKDYAALAATLEYR